MRGNLFALQTQFLNLQKLKQNDPDALELIEECLHFIGEALGKIGEPEVNLVIYGLLHRLDGSLKEKDDKNQSSKKIKSNRFFKFFFDKHDKEDDRKKIDRFLQQEDSQNAFLLLTGMRIDKQKISDLEGHGNFFELKKILVDTIANIQSSNVVLSHISDSLLGKSECFYSENELKSVKYKLKEQNRKYTERKLQKFDDMFAEKPPILRKSKLPLLYSLQEALVPQKDVPDSQLGSKRTPDKSNSNSKAP